MLTAKSLAIFVVNRREDGHDFTKFGRNQKDVLVVEVVLVVKYKGL